MNAVVPSRVPFNEKMEDIMLVENLKMHFPVTQGLLKRQVGAVKAVDGVSFAVKRGQTLGVVGESGSGKSTIGNCLLSRLPVTEGDIWFEGSNLRDIPANSMRKLRKSLQMITQDPFASLDPRFTVRDCITEGIEIHHLIQGKKALNDRVAEMLDMVGLRQECATRYPHEFSGGQRQRISIARALAIQPSFIVCDEVVSALDVSIQAQIVSLLMKLQEDLGLTYVFIGHDLSVVRYISHQVAVLYLGKIVELTSSDELYDHPLHPYTQALISAAPIPNPDVDRARERIILKGEIPSPMNPPKGCKFCTRCPYVEDICREEEPKFMDVGNQHFVACHKVTGR
jgi:oligopeptide transport system ATP-binding protein